MKGFLLIIFCGVMDIVWGVAPKDINYHPVDQLLGHSYSRKSRFMDEVSKGRVSPEEEKNPEFWHASAQSELAKRLAETQINNNPAKNVIFFLGDGMSLSTVAASRIRKGQLRGNPGEEDSLSFEKFPHGGLSRTYCANAQVADSACTSTAYMCGVKANIVTLGVPANVLYNNCSMSMNPENHLTSIADLAQREGKSTGFVTTTTLTHASPSGMYAKAASRFWQSDADIPDQIRQQGPCMDMAQQLIKWKTGRNLDVLMGGGMGKFLPNTVMDAHGKPGERLDGRNLLNLWQEMNPSGALVTNRDELLNLNISKTSKIMGIFESSLMDFHALADCRKQPTLSEMTEMALRLLRRNDKGYYIFIEGGLIDYGNHYNRPYLSLDETLEMEKAVQLAVDMTNPNDTLIVVSADHAHPLTISGYPRRGTDILGLNQDGRDSNGVKYTTLNYAVGMDQYLDENGKRINLEDRMSNKLNFVHPSQIPASIGVHAGDDVGVYAHGAQSHLFRGVMQQHSLPHIMAYAACLGDGPTACNPQGK